MIRFFVLLVALVCSGCAVKTAGPLEKTGAQAGVGETKTDVKDAVLNKGDNGHGGNHHDNNDPRPYDETRNAMADVNSALNAAALSGKNILLVLGGNWCHDSRGLAGKFQREELSHVIADSYELVFVDVGHRDRNLDVGARFGVPELYGTPTVLILSPEGMLLNRESVHDWRTADSKPYDETLAYFQRFAEGGQ